MVSIVKRFNLIALQVLLLFIIVFTVGVGYRALFTPSEDQWQPFIVRPFPKEPPSSEVQYDAPARKPESAPSAATMKLYQIAPYVSTIMDPKDTVISRLECPMPHPTRYEYLQPSESVAEHTKTKYFFALDLRDSFKVIPRLLGSIVETVLFLGPSACALSIVEGYSSDDTLYLLDALRPELDNLGLKYFLQSSSVDSKTGERIENLAALRNQALAPLESLGADADTSIIFLNDVAICMEDILELVHQRVLQSADMTCAMDWVYVGKDPTFYDVWVARTMKGETFFDIPKSGSWDWAWNLFWNDPFSREKFDNKLPFQVYACWNGAVVFGAGPILGLPTRVGGNEDGTAGPSNGTKVSFRASREGECHAGEPTLFCKDLWWAGYGKIAVVPSVNLEYSDEKAKQIKDEKGYTSKWTDKWGNDAAMINWVADPPEKVKCMPGWENQSWRPWNETLR